MARKGQPNELAGPGSATGVADLGAAVLLWSISFWVRSIARGGRNSPGQ
jgi:hypothetical protein